VRDSSRPHIAKISGMPESLGIGSGFQGRRYFVSLGTAAGAFVVRDLSRPPAAKISGMPESLGIGSGFRDGRYLVSLVVLPPECS